MDIVAGYDYVDWLKDQARQSFMWDRKSVQWRAMPREPAMPVYETFAACYEGLYDIRAYFPNLHHNKMAAMFEGEAVNEIEKVGDILTRNGYTDFSFLDHGGRALAFRARHTPTGHMHVVRVEAPHHGRQVRPDHTTVLPTHFAYEGADIQGIKIETLDEIMPLSKLPDCPHPDDKDSVFARLFHSAVYNLAQGTNMTYPAMGDHAMFDRDAEPQNVGLTPAGKIVTLDPEIVAGSGAERKHRDFTIPFLLRDATPQQLRLVYGR